VNFRLLTTVLWRYKAILNVHRKCLCGVNHIILGDVVAVNLKIILVNTNFGTSMLSPEKIHAKDYLTFHLNVNYFLNTMAIIVTTNKILNTVSIHVA